MRRAALVQRPALARSGASNSLSLSDSSAGSRDGGYDWSSAPFFPPWLAFRPALC